MLIPADDRGFTLGDGLFETLLAVRGRVIALEAHLDRLDRGCAALGLPTPDRDEIAAALATALFAQGLTDARAAVRLSWSAGSGGRGLDRPDPVRPRLTATAAPAPTPGRPLTLVTAGVRRNHASPASRLKSLNYLDNVLARREARAAGADEALMLNTKGEVACAAAGNLFWLAGGTLHTPALACGVLDGVVRGRLLARLGTLGLEGQETAGAAAALAAAEAIFVSNSLIGLAPVLALDGRPLAPHPLTAALQSLIAELIPA